MNLKFEKDIFTNLLKYFKIDLNTPKLYIIYFKLPSGFLGTFFADTTKPAEAKFYLQFMKSNSILTVCTENDLSEITIKLGSNDSSTLWKKTIHENNFSMLETAAVKLAYELLDGKAEFISYERYNELLCEQYLVNNFGFSLFV